jgi:hypothetical protein
VNFGGILLARGCLAKNDFQSGENTK